MDIEEVDAELRELTRKRPDPGDCATPPQEAGVDVVLDIIPGAPHGFENWARDPEPSRTLMKRSIGWLHRFLPREVEPAS